MVKLRSCYAFDIDGVVADVSKRLSLALSMSGGVKNNIFWEVFFDERLIEELDTPRNVGVDLVKDRAGRGCIVVITGRPKRLRDVSIKEFIKFTGVRPALILMRGNRDFRPSYIVKLKLIDQVLRLGYEIIEFHDDDLEVLKNVKRLYPFIRLYYHFNNKFKLL
mgnify:CR=1 FL=1